MSLIDNATLVIGAGNYFVSPTGTALPANLLAPAAPWENIGHTSLEDILSAASEGGEATIIGTLQNKSLRTQYSNRIETFNITIQQFDAESLKLFYGSNMVTNGDGTMGVPTSPTVTVKGFCAIFTDGSKTFALYAPKAEIFRADDLALADTESLAGLPIGVKPVAYNGNSWTYALTPLS